MLKNLLKNSVIYTISDFLGKIISFFLIPIYTQILTPQDYGIIDLFAMISSIALMMFTFQINQGMARYYHELSRKFLIKVYASTTLLFTLVSFIFFCTIALVFKDSINNYFFSNELTNETMYVIIALVFVKGLFYITSSHLKWKLEPIKQSICNMANTLLGIAFSFFFIVIEKEGVFGFFKGQLIGVLIGFVISILFSIKDYGPYFSIKILKKLLIFGSPLILSAASIFIITYTDRAMINHYLGLDSIGIYGIGMRISSILSFFVVGLNAALSPLIYNHYKKGELPSELSYVFKIFNVVLIIGITILSVFSKEILILLTTPDYYSAKILIPIFSLTILVQSWSNFSPGLSIAMKTRLITIISIVAGIVNLILNFILLPSFGLIGAAIATLISYLLIFFLLHSFGKKEYQVRLFSNKLVLIAIFALTIYFLSLCITGYKELVIVCLKFGLITLFIMCTLFVIRNELSDFIAKITNKLR